MGIWLVMKSATGNERPFPIQKNLTVIGRAPMSDVRISVPSVAPRHCEITLDGEGLRMTDLGSVAGTLHNGNRVGEAVLSVHDRLTVGPITFEVRRTEDEGLGAGDGDGSLAMPTMTEPRITEPRMTEPRMTEPKPDPAARQPHQNRWSV